MASDANLLVTYEPSHYASAEREVKALLGKEAKFAKSPVEGVFLLKTKNPKKSVEAVRKEFSNDPSLFRYTFSWVPVDKWYPADVKKLAGVMKTLDKKLDASKSWKMEINKRLHKASTSELIMKLTDPISKTKVDLKNPEQIVRVEILKNKAGVSLLSPNEIFSIPGGRK